MLVLYSITIFISAFLLFLVQPMVGKMVLPLYGGAPAIWNSCMFFFQTILLLGYAFVHYSIKWLGYRRQLFLHLPLLIFPLALLPFSIEQNNPPQNIAPEIWLLTRLAITVGLPFMVVSCSAPILQYWFSQTDHRSADDPYFLYAASNSGSLLALLAYPLLLEPAHDLTEQSRLWTFGFLLLVLMTVSCICWLHSKNSDRDPVYKVKHRTSAQTISQPKWRTRFFWIYASFVPSSLMLGVTAYLSTNIAAFPLLWVIPLAIYLITFILVFARRKILPQNFFVKSFPYLTLVFAPLFFVTPGESKSLLIPIHLFMFFMIAMTCHGELAQRRPAAIHLTDFYLCLSLGGVLGGFFNTIIAPILFDRIFEYAFAMFLACYILPDKQSHTMQRQSLKGDIITVSIFAMICFAITTATQFFEINKISTLFLYGFIPLSLICFSFKEKRFCFTVAYGILLLTFANHFERGLGEPIHVSRNFFGTKRVFLTPENNMHQLVHGTTNHGTQLRAADKQEIPLSYYHPSGPIGDIFSVLEEDNPLGDVAIIGLGTGAIASYAVHDQHIDFYEIDPAIKQIAYDNKLFTYLSKSKGKIRVTLGDGRLTLAETSRNGYSLIVLDAFSSDAIPIHLLTKEALQLYLQKINVKGMLAFHITNRFLNLEPILANLADELDLICYVRDDQTSSATNIPIGKSTSKYMVMGYRRSIVEKFSVIPEWRTSHQKAGIRTWTDQYSNVFNILEF